MKSRFYVPGGLKDFRPDSFFFFALLFIERMHLIKDRIHNTAFHLKGKYRLDAAAHAGNNADGAGRGKGGEGCVSAFFYSTRRINTMVETWKVAAFFGQFRRCLFCVLLDSLHDCLGKTKGLIALIRNPQHDKHVGKPHQAKADLAIALAQFLYPPERIPVDFNNVVEKVNAKMDQVIEFFVIDPAVFNQTGQVYRTEVA